MDQHAVFDELGLPVGAGPEEVREAYASLSRPLKAMILSATSAATKERHRASLRDLVRSRDLALGIRPPEGWRAGRYGERSRPVLARLEVTPTAGLDAIRARAFFGLKPNASAEEVERAYEERKRALIRRFAVARDDAELQAARRARNKLKTIRNFAL
jgi:hypothetical protein